MTKTIETKNAQLIAAAPEMYEALKFMIDNFNTGDMGGFMNAVNKGIPRAQKALAKAEGKDGLV